MVAACEYPNPMQPWHVNDEEHLVDEEGTTFADLGRGHYDPHGNVVVIEQEPRDTKTGKLDPTFHRVVLDRLKERWPTAQIITRE